MYVHVTAIDPTARAIAMSTRANIAREELAAGGGALLSAEAGHEHREGDEQHGRGTRDDPVGRAPRRLLREPGRGG
ncbi:hypothetical protein GCM10025873_13010 [Demequina sediminis]|nr:hypothetical protein GCM10025873_13010 [Demequina sediminis]